VRPIVARVTEAHPALRRLHVLGETHPGELAERGYVRRGEEWVLDIRRPEEPGRDADVLLREFEVLSRMGYDFAAGEEWSPLELYRKYRDMGRLTGEER
jgi:hypothetical protein